MSCYIQKTVICNTKNRIFIQYAQKHGLLALSNSVSFFYNYPYTNMLTIIWLLIALKKYKKDDNVSDMMRIV
jgi:hypothetical protein